MYSLIHPRDTALDSPVQTGPARVQERMHWEFYAPDAVRLGSAVTSLRILRRICWWLDPPLSRWAIRS